MAQSEGVLGVMHSNGDRMTRAPEHHDHGAADALRDDQDDHDDQVREAALSAVTRMLHEAESRLRQTEKRLREVEDRHRYQVYRTEYVTWQLKSSFARRWWRLGNALWQVKRKPSRIMRLPVEIVRAAQPSVMPVPPARPGRKRARAGRPDAAQSPRDDRPAMPDIPSLALPDGPVVRPGLTVAVIADDFTATALRYEWRQVTPGPDDWREVLAAERPALLFVESAWFGNQRRWGGHVAAPRGPSQTLRDIVGWCRDQGIPTVFWNKEDPPNFDIFIAAAKLFDYVFTTCGEMVPRYRELLRHDRVGVLSFAAQPRIHNPVNVPGGRKYEVAFAGTYFNHKHPRRAEQMATVLEPARGFGLHIFSRMLAKDQRFQFPEQFDRHVVGSLPYERMLAAYKSYKVFLNVNSVIDSPTMCARRIFELSACRTPVLSGYSRAVERFFPGLVSVANTPADTQTLLAGLLANPELRDRQAHLAMREVFAKHTFGHRIDDVLDAIGKPMPRREPYISVIMATNRPGRLAHAIEQVARQRWRRLQLVLVLHGVDMEPEVVRDKALAAGIGDVAVLTADRAKPLGEILNLAIDAADGDLIAKMDDDDLYGEHYLSDLVPAFSYTDAGIVGKRACYVQLRAINATLLSKPELEHSYSGLVRGGTILASGDVLRGLRFDHVPRGSDTKLMRRAREEGIQIYSADRFNYVYVRSADPNTHTFQVNDAELLKQARVEFYGPPEQHVCI
jgi:spore maturation protein CgeB